MRIIHVFRSPIGGLFRHVRDLVRCQQAAGHDVGIICDSLTGGATAPALLAKSQPHCSLGIETMPMGRLPGFNDLIHLNAIVRKAKELGATVLHGHGAKGGLYARLAAAKLGIASVYTPHGGSLHFEWKSPAGAVFLATERYLARKGSGFIFVCDFERRLFEEKIGLAGKPWTVVHNGLWPDEFAPALPSITAKDLLFVGEVRHLKGIDILLDALKLMQSSRPCTLSIVGDGPELETYRRRVPELGLQGQVSFDGRLAIRDAFKLGKLFVVPSRNESFPYVVLEAAAASVPMIATSVGGIPELLPEDLRITTLNPAELAAKIAAALTNMREAAERARALSQSMANRYTVDAMSTAITAFYKTLPGSAS